MDDREYEYIESEDNYEMAVEWIREGQYGKAVDCLKKSIALNPNFIYAYVTLAEAHAKLNGYSEAFHILKKASKVDPDFDRLNYLMARYAFKEGNYPASLKSIDRAIEISPLPLYLKSRKVILKAIDKLKEIPPSFP